MVTAAADVRVPEEVKAAVDACVEQLGGLLPSIVVNNAAGNFISPTERLSPNAFRSVVDIVLLGTVNVTLDIARRLIHAKQPGTSNSTLPTSELLQLDMSFYQSTVQLG